MNDMNGYTLSRNFWDWAFENPELIKPNHAALYFFCIEHCNRLGWKRKFGLPTEMAKDAIGIKSYGTYSRTFKDLVEFGLIEVIELSRNQYSANIIALSNFNKANDKALDKATVKHVSKQVYGTGESTGESIDSIYKPLTNNHKQENKEKKKSDFPFLKIWNIYDKKNKRMIAEKKYNSLPEKTKELIFKDVPLYVKETPDKKFRKDFTTYLNQKTWLDEREKSKSNDEWEKYENMTDEEKELRKEIQHERNGGDTWN